MQVIIILLLLYYMKLYWFGTSFTLRGALKVVPCNIAFIHANILQMEWINEM
jgi:hypothetical protein